MKKAALFLISLLLWVCLTWRIDLMGLLPGIVVSGLLGYFMGDVFFSMRKGPFKPMRILFAVSYAAIFIYRAFAANIFLALKLFSRQPEVGAGIVRVKTALKGDGEALLFAGMLLFSPSAMLVDLEEGGARIYLSDGASRKNDALKSLTGTAETTIKGVFE